MGIVVNFLVLENHIIDAFKEDKSIIDTYLEREDNEWYGSDRKVWSPMFELLFILDSSNNNIMREVENKEYYIDESKYNSRGYLLYSNIVSEIWKALKVITREIFIKNVEDPVIIEEIKSIPGYRNEFITYKNGVLMVYEEFYEAVENANRQNKGLYIYFD